MFVWEGLDDCGELRKTYLLGCTKPEKSREARKKMKNSKDREVGLTEVFVNKRKGMRNKERKRGEREGTIRQFRKGSGVSFSHGGLCQRPNTRWRGEGGRHKGRGKRRNLDGKESQIRPMGNGETVQPGFFERPLGHNGCGGLAWL